MCTFFYSFDVSSAQKLFLNNEENHPEMTDTYDSLRLSKFSV
jgi:hypothetical protein